MKRLAVLIASTFALPAMAADPPPPKPVVLKPGKPLDKCIQLDQGQKLEYRFSTPAKVNFHLRYNRGDQAYYPVKLDRTLGESGVFEAKARERYCLSWENRTDADVELTYATKTYR